MVYEPIDATLLSMDKKIDIHKVAGILIQDRKLLISRSKGKSFFISPGGKLEKGETGEDALVRELNEEVGVVVNANDLTAFGTFFAPAAGVENKYLQMDVFFVNRWEGEIIPANEVEEVLWVNSESVEGIEIGSVFGHDVIPKLKEENYID